MIEIPTGFTLRFGLPGQNEILAAKGATYSPKGSRRRSAYTGMKKKYTGLVADVIRARGCIPERPHDMIMVSCVWIEPHRRRDLDNISGGLKFIFDAMVDTKVIPNDNLMHIQNIRHGYLPSTDGNRGVVVSWSVIDKNEV